MNPGGSESDRGFVGAPRNILQYSAGGPLDFEAGSDAFRLPGLEAVREPARRLRRSVRR